MIDELRPMPIRPAYRQYGYVQVIGRIWQPGIGPCAMERDLSDYDVNNIEQPITRDSVLDWIYLHMGDFREICDFAAYIDGVTIPWADEESELTYLDCMDPIDDVEACVEDAEGEDDD